MQFGYLENKKGLIRFASACFLSAAIYLQNTILLFYSNKKFHNHFPVKFQNDSRNIFTDLNTKKWFRTSPSCSSWSTIQLWWAMDKHCMQPHLLKITKAEDYIYCRYWRLIQKYHKKPRSTNNPAKRNGSLDIPHIGFFLLTGAPKRGEPSVDVWDLAGGKGVLPGWPDSGTGVSHWSLKALQMLPLVSQK